MVGPSKILTVSYGTFSCTLEGFDDPFNTMKAIAEYFRDLAADDRYFGAEPPVPDAAMLHRIAEREIQRRVEARVQDGGVLLRAADLAPPAAAAPAAAPAAAAPAPAPAPAPAAPRLHPVSPSIEESVAAKLARIRAAVDRARVVSPPVADIEDAEEVAPARPAPVPAPAPVVAAPPAAEPMPAPTPATAASAPAAATAEPPAAPADRPAEAQPAPAAEPARAVEPVEPPADIAPAVAEAATDAGPHGADTAPAPSEPAAIAEADAPVAEPAAAAPAAAETAEDRAVEPVAAEIAEERADEPVAAEIAEDRADEPVATEIAEDRADEPVAMDVAEDRADEPVAMDVAEDRADEPVAMDVAEDRADEPVAMDVAEDRADESVAMDVAEERADEPALRAEAVAASDTVVAEAAADLPAADATPPAAAVEAREPDLAALIGRIAAVAPATVSEPDAAAEAPVAAAPAVDDPSLDDDDVPPAAPRARVIKVRRLAVPPAPAEDDAIPPAGRLSPEAEAELARELAEVEREMAGGGAPTPAAAERRPAAPPAAPGDDAVSRLMKQASTEMNGPETRRRAATIQHLKAAVAATVAERAAGAALSDQSDRIEPYRDDLAQAVRPRRPEALPGTGRRRPDSGTRIPPLVLVSEQRIDRPAIAAEPTPIRPRRVTTGSLALTRDLDVEDDLADDIADAADANIFAAPARFAEIARRLGATQLPDLLEAAAAYITVAEGRDSFTRPQLVRLAQSFAGAEIGREDGLRSFGILMREGLIVRARRGQFALSPDSRLLAETKALMA